MVGVEPVANALGNPWTPVLGAVDEMDQVLDQGLGHLDALRVVSPFQGFVCVWRFMTQGGAMRLAPHLLCPWADFWLPLSGRKAIVRAAAGDLQSDG